MASLQTTIMPMEMAAARQQQRFLQALHYLAPTSVLSYFLITTAISACKLHNLKASGTGPRKVVIPLVCLVVVSFLVESCMLIVDTAISDACHSSRDSIVSLFPRIPGRQDPASIVLTTSCSGLCIIFAPRLDQSCRQPCKVDEARCLVPVLRLVVDWTGHRSNLVHLCPHLRHFTKCVRLCSTNSPSVPHAHPCPTIHGPVHYIFEGDRCR